MREEREADKQTRTEISCHGELSSPWLCEHCAVTDLLKLETEQQAVNTTPTAYRHKIMANLSYLPYLNIQQRHKYSCFNHLKVLDFLSF